MDVWQIIALTSTVLIGKWFFLLFLHILKISYVHFCLRVFCKQKNLVLDYGTWAVITGASDGIGKCYSQELAKRGMNLVLASRSLEKLQALCDEIEKTYGVQTIAVKADFSVPSDDDEYAKIFLVTKDLDVGILVNNVGIADGLPNRLENMTRAQIWNIIVVNIVSAVSMTHYFLSKMKSKGRGLIINMGSISCIGPTPYATLYGASKAFIKRFSDSLIDECFGTGVEVQTITPAFIDTKITTDTNAYKQPRLFYPSPEIFAESAVNTLGRTSNTTGYWPHDLQYFAMDTAPQWMQIWAAKKFIDFEKMEKIK